MSLIFIKNILVCSNCPISLVLPFFFILIFSAFLCKIRIFHRFAKFHVLVFLLYFLFIILKNGNIYLPVIYSYFNFMFREILPMLKCLSFIILFVRSLSTYTLCILLPVLYDLLMKDHMFLFVFFCLKGD